MPGTYHLMPALNPTPSGNGHQQGYGAVGDRTRIVLRPIGSPLPLGLLALACAGLLLSLEQLGTFTTATDLRTIAIVLLGFSVPLMLIASIFSFLARDTVAGSALGLFAGAWLASG